MQIFTSSICIANQSPFGGLFHSLQGVSVASLVFFHFCFAADPRSNDGNEDIYSEAYDHLGKLQK